MSAPDEVQAAEARAKDVIRTLVPDMRSGMMILAAASAWAKAARNAERDRLTEQRAEQVAS